MGQERLCVQMFGKFSMQYGGRAIAFRKMDSAKTVRLLQMLLISGKDGVAKSELTDCLYSWEECATARSRSKNMNKLIYRLRDQLVANGLPQEEYITIRGGICRFECSFPVEVDTARLEALCQKAKEQGGEERLACLKEAVQLYTGELLPMNQTDIWFFGRSNDYKELYLSAVRQLAAAYRRQEDYKSLVQLYTKTIDIYPFDNWQTELLRCHLEWGKQEEALRLYTATMELYARERELPPKKEMQQCFEELSPKPGIWHWKTRDVKEMECAEETFLGTKEHILRLVAQDDHPGACYCTYPSFVDYCRILRRLQERLLVGGSLMFLMLTRNTKKTLGEKSGQDVQMKLLKEAVRLSLRKGDAYTRYGDNGYVLLLVNQIPQTSFAGIFRRIEDCYGKMEKSRGELWYQVIELGKI